MNRMVGMSDWHRNSIPRLLRHLSGQGAASLDVSDVIEVAQALETGEFRIFKLAYVNFYGEKADSRIVAPHFLKYLFKQIVPPFVRHFTHKVLESQRRGRLARAEFGLGRRAGTTTLPDDSDASRAAMLAALLLGIAALAYSL